MADGQRAGAGRQAEVSVVGNVAIETNESDPDAITREQRRSRRKRQIRARTISVKRMTKRELEIGRMMYPETDYWKPRTRAECTEGPRPCPYVSCKHHLYVDVSPRTGAIKLNFPDLEVWEMGESCALDIADRGGTTLEDVGAIMNLTRERIRQVEVKALAKLEVLREMDHLRDFVEEGPQGKRRLPQLSDEELAGIGARGGAASGSNDVDSSDTGDSEQNSDTELSPASELQALPSSNDDDADESRWDEEVPMDPSSLEDGTIDELGVFL